MIMKKIMILGAGIYQVPLIETAKKMGLYTIVVSIPGNYPGFAIADKVYYENTVDDEKILEIAQNRLTVSSPPELMSVSSPSEKSVMQWDCPAFPMKPLRLPSIKC